MDNLNQKRGINIKVLSLFDGISCGRLAFERAGIYIEKYYASEVDKHAVQIAQKNYPDTVQLGDITELDFNRFAGEVDIVIGGSPCTHWSIARRDRETTSSGIGFDLFMHYVRAVRESKAKYFLYENNHGIHKDIQKEISDQLGVEPILINSDLVSAQSRKRLYWTNIPGITQPTDKGVYLKDIVLEDAIPVALHNLYGGFKEKSVRVFEGKSPTIRTAAGGGHIPSFIKKDIVTSDQANENIHIESENIEEISTQLGQYFKGVSYNHFKEWDIIRKFDPIECERLQTLPDNYTEGVSNTQRYKMIGNGWTIDVIAHIFKHIALKDKLIHNDTYVNENKLFRKAE